MPTYEETQISKKLPFQSESGQLKASLREHNNYMWEMLKRAPKPQRDWKHICQMLFLFSCISVDLSVCKWLAHSLNSVNEEVTKRCKRATGGVIWPTMPKTCPLAHSLSNKNFLPFPVCLRLHENQCLKNTVTSQTCQINHTCCNVIIYNHTHRKTCYSGVNRRCRGAGGTMRGFIWSRGDARCTLVLRCLQEMLRCFVQVQLRLIMSRPRNSFQGYYEDHNIVQTTIFISKTGNIYLRT